MIVSTPREALWVWVNTKLGIPWSEDFRAIGALREDCLCAVVAYNGFTGRTCFMHSAIDDPAVINRTFVKAIFDYPFNHCKLTHVLALVESSNTRAMKIDLRLGFKEVNRFEGAGLDGSDLVLLSMARNECKWIGAADGKEERTPGT